MLTSQSMNASIFVTAQVNFR